MSTIEVIRASQARANAAKEAAALLKQKYPDLLLNEPLFEQFVKLLVQH